MTGSFGPADEFALRLHELFGFGDVAARLGDVAARFIQSEHTYLRRCLSAAFHQR